MTSGGRANEQPLPEPVRGERVADLRQPRAAAADVDPARQQVAAPSSSITSSTPAAQTSTSSATILRDLVALLDGEAPGVVDLERLGPRERQVEPVGEALRERPTAEREHPGALDPALADERHVGRAAADVDEQRAGLADLLGAEDPRDRVRLGDDLQQLEVELRGDALERPEVDERRERVEDPDLHVAALEPDRVRERVAVDRRPDDRRVDEPDVDVRQAGLPRDRPLGLAQRLALDARR